MNHKQKWRTLAQKEGVFILMAFLVLGCIPTIMAGIDGTDISQQIPDLGNQNNIDHSNTEKSLPQPSGTSSATLEFSTYFGGLGDDDGYGIGLDANGNYYVMGHTYSANYFIVNAYDDSYNGAEDTYVAKFSSTGTLLWSTYLGGTSSDEGYGFAVSTSGEIYICGYTYSSDFPTLNAYNTTYGGNGDIFVSKFGTSGNLLWSTYFGGLGTDYIEDQGDCLAIDNTGACYIVGYGSSTNLPTTVGVINATSNGNYDGYIAKFSSSGSLIMCSYLGSTESDELCGITIDQLGNYYITGYSYSANFPKKNQAYNYVGGGEPVVCKFNSANQLLWSTYIGGSGDDYGYSIAVDANNNVFVIGEEQSNNFPLLNAQLVSHEDNSDSDIFIAKFSPTGVALWSTSLGGENYEYANRIAIDTLGNCYLSGQSESYNTFFTQNAFDTDSEYCTDAVLAKFSNNGDLCFSTFFGVDSDGYGIAVDNEGGIFFIGETWGNRMPTLNAYNASYSGNDDAFIAHLKCWDNTNQNNYFSTYLGDSDEDDEGDGIAIDAYGNCYVIGQTASPNFPTTPGAYNETINVDDDTFITKFAPNGTMIWSTFFGGSDMEYGNGIAVDIQGNVYITGYTSSANFPTTVGAFNRTYGGVEDIYVAKFSSIGALIWSTFIGGDDDEESNAIAVDSVGNCFITGWTTSTYFPTTIGAFNRTMWGTQDAFVTRFTTDGALSWSSYLGGSTYNDEGHGIAVDSSGNCIVTGDTSSADFPTTTGAFNQTMWGTADIFITKFSPTGTMLYSTFFGGSNSEYQNWEGSALAVDAAGNWYVTGSTYSANFPTLNAYDNSLAGTIDTFISKFSTSGTLTYSTYLGGTSDEETFGIAVDAAGNFAVTGETYSTNFPTTMNAFASTKTGYTDVFISRFASTGLLTWSTFLGGENDYDGDTPYQEGHEIALDASGNIFVTGTTEAVDFPIFHATDPLNDDDSGFEEVFVTKLPAFVISTPVDVQYTVGSTGHEVTWSFPLTETNAAIYNISQNGVIVQKGFWSAGGLVHISVDGLQPGTYTFFMNASNMVQGPVNDTVIVTVFNAPTINSPIDLQIPMGIIGNKITWTITDISISSGSYTITQNGTTIASSTWSSGTAIQLAIDRLAGTYNFTIVGVDGYGGIVIDTVIVVVSNNLPIITNPVDIALTAVPTSLILSWTPTDDSVNATTCRYILYRNGTQIATGTWTSGTALDISVTDLAVGNYNYTIVLEDGFGASVSDELWVRITSSSSNNPATTWTIIGISSGVIIIVGGFAYSYFFRGNTVGFFHRLHFRQGNFSLGDFRGRWRRRF